jgi:Flp pilus assembly protein TadB
VASAPRPRKTLTALHESKEDRAMNISVAHLHAIVAIVTGILILVVPRLLSYLVAIYLILTGLVGLGIGLHMR